MEHFLSRTELLLGPEKLVRLAKLKVAVFGLGGVGGMAAEALVRSGIGAIDLIDNDQVMASNLNRQIFATYTTIGQDKVTAAKARLLEINPTLAISTHKTFFTSQTASQFNFSQYDYVADAIDTVTSKLELVERTFAAGVPIISAMGAGNKLDPTAFQVTDIFKTSICPLARVMRQELKKRGIPRLTVVYSQEPPLTPRKSLENPNPGRRQTPGSVSFVPPVVGLILASHIIKELTK